MSALGIRSTGGLTFERFESRLRVSFVWSRYATNAMEIVQVGNRWGLIQCGVVLGVYPASLLLTALRDYRQAAGWAREEQADAERAAA
jgi:hypothetical protein